MTYKNMIKGSTMLFLPWTICLLSNGGCRRAKEWTRKPDMGLILWGFNTLVILVAWRLWKERNKMIHEFQALQPVALAQEIVDEANLWAMRGLLQA
ncbi:hypothetical protein EJB05_14953, partial [Eragrostis curvula]